MSKKPFLFALFFMAPPVVAWCQTAENPQKPSVYIVKKGDCLWNISKRVWGDPVKWPLLFAANEGKINNPNLIYPGQKFTIPTTLTAEELKKASELAQERAVPLPARRGTGVEGTTLQAHKKHHAALAGNETSAASSASKPAPSAPSANEPPQNGTNPAVPGSQPVVNAANPTGAAPTGSGTSVIGIAILFILALGGGLYLWFRKRSGGMAQQPRPLSSFPPIEEPPVSRPGVSDQPAPQGLGGERKAPSPASTPSGQAAIPPATPAVPKAPSPSPSGTIPPVNPQPPKPLAENPPAQPSQETLPGTKGGEFTGTITSISVSQPPQPSKAEPPSSSGLPSTPAPSSAPSTPAASTPPVPKPPENKPPDTTPNPPPSTP